MNEKPTIFKGDVAIQTGLDTALYGLGRLDVAYDAVIGGVLTEINSTNITISDNLPIFNYPATVVGRDIGTMGSRNLTNVIADTPAEFGTATGGTITTITLDPASSAVDDFYNGYVIYITAGTGSGQVRTITDYVGATKIATVDADWITTPDATSDYELFLSRNIAIYWDEDEKEFIVGFTPDPHTSPNIDVTPGDLRVNNLILDGSIIGLQETVCLFDNSSTPADITKTDLRGSYFIIATSIASDGATATFSASKADSTTAGVTLRITSDPGVNGEELDITWPAGDPVQLYHSTTSGVGTLLCYNVRIFSVEVIGGEANTGANIGNAGFGPFESKVGVVLQFRNTAAGSNKIDVSYDAPNYNIEIDAVEANFTLDNIGGVLSVSKGGTSLSSLTANRFLVGNGVGPVDLTKVVPVGDVVGTTDSQALTNKTMTDASNDIVARGLWYGSGSAYVSTYASAAPSVGYVLTATSATTATWQPASSTFGSEFESASSTAPVTTTTFIDIVLGTITGGVTKLSFITAVKPIGTYRVDYFYNWTNDGTARDFISCVTVDGLTTADLYASMRSGQISNTGGLDTDPFAIPGSGNDQSHTDCGFFYVTFGAAAAHTIRVLFGRGTTGSGAASISMSNLLVQIMRVA